MPRPARIGILLLAVFAVVLLRNAWVSDDAFITLRTVDNAWNGYGLRWNVAERVQTYTHPAWMLLLLVAYGITGEPWISTLALGLLTSLAAVAVIVHAAPNRWAAIAATLPLLASKAWVDFATSGLENPLTHLLLGLGALSLVRGGTTPRDLGRTTAICALGLLNRLDAAVLFGPLFFVHASRVPRTRAHLGAVVAASLPLTLWSAFATVYYGSPLPNTAFAKLANGYPLAERIGQGLSYAVHLVRHQPISAALVALGPVLAVQQRSRAAVALGFGATLHVLYVIWAGGDFMAGRLFTPAIFATALLIALQERTGWTATVAAGVLGLSLLSPYAPLRATDTYRRQPAWNGVVDERGFYWRGAGLPSVLRGELHPFAQEGARQRPGSQPLRAAVGLYAYYAGPDVHVVDPLGLGDPLLARLPAQYDPAWRVGHYRRAIPMGYAPGHDRGPVDAELVGLWDTVRTVTRGPIGDPARFGAIVRYNLPGPTPFSARFPGLKQGRTPSTIGARGARFDAVLTAVAGVPGDPWAIVFTDGSVLLADHRITLNAGWTALPAPPPGTTSTLVFPAGGRGIAQNLEDVR